MDATAADNRTQRAEQRMPRIALTALAVGLCALVMALLVLAAVPPVSRDALTHHLLVPKLYLAHGGIYEIPSIIFSYYPMNLDLLYAIPLYFGNDILPKFIHMVFGLMTAWLIFAYLKKRMNTAYGLLGALLFLSLPVIVKLSITVYVDLGLVFFSTAAMLVLLKWAETGFRRRHLAVAGICCGLALGTKYNGLLVFFLLTLFVPVAYVRHCGRQSWLSLRGAGHGAFFMLIALVVFSPWMARNIVWKGNPLYPMHDSLLKVLRPLGPVTASKEMEKKVVGPLDHFTYRRVAFEESWWQIAAVPIRIFFQGRDDNPQYFDGRLNPYLLFFPLVAVGFFMRGPPRERREKSALALFAGLFLLYAFLGTDMRIRYIAPILPPLVMLTVYGVRDLVQAVGGIAKTGLRRGVYGCAGAIAIVFLLPNVNYVLGQFAQVRPLSYLSGAVSRDAYIRQYRPEYEVFSHVNRHLPQTAKILSLFLGNRLYYSDRQIAENVGLFAGSVRSMQPPEEICRQLQQHGYTHLMIRFDLFERWMGDNCNPRQLELLRAFFRSQTTLLFRYHGYGLLELKG